MLRPKSRTLLWLRGPGFITIVDERPGMPHARYTLDDCEAAIYLACDAGATPAQVQAALAARSDGVPEVSEITDFLAELTAAGLVYEEAGRYLSLAIARKPRMHADVSPLREPSPAPDAAPLVAIRRSASRP